MKRSISLAPVADERLEAIVARWKSNPSVVIEAAVLRFADLVAAEQERDLRYLHNQRRAATRDGWMKVFWGALAEEFGAKDFDFTGQGNPLTPRQHGGFTVVFLYDPESPMAGPIYVHAFENPPAPDNRSLIQNWTFERTEPVYVAARTVATWIRSHKRVESTEGR